LLELVQE
jgi:hypothetical protein